MSFRCCTHCCTLSYWEYSFLSYNYTFAVSLYFSQYLVSALPQYLLKATIYLKSKRKVCYVMELNFTKIGEKIKRVRKEKGLTQEQLAELTHLSVTHISAIETARSSFSVSTLVNIAAVLEISTDWILFEGREISHCVEHQISRVLFDCSEKEVLILLTLLENNKAALRKLADMEY